MNHKVLALQEKLITTEDILQSFLDALNGNKISCTVRTSEDTWITQTGTPDTAGRMPLKGFMAKVLQNPDLYSTIPNFEGGFTDNVLFRFYPGAQIQPVRGNTIQVATESGTVVATIAIDNASVPPVLQGPVFEKPVKSPGTFEDTLEAAIPWVFSHPHGPDIVRLATGKTQTEVFEYYAEHHPERVSFSPTMEHIASFFFSVQEKGIPILMSMGDPNAAILQWNAPIPNTASFFQSLKMSSNGTSLSLGFSDISQIVVVNFKGMHNITYKGVFFMDEDGKAIASVFVQPPRTHDADILKRFQKDLKELNTLITRFFSSADS